MLTLCTFRNSNPCYYFVLILAITCCFFNGVGARAGSRRHGMRACSMGTDVRSACGAPYYMSAPLHQMLLKRTCCPG